MSKNTPIKINQLLWRGADKVFNKPSLKNKRVIGIAEHKLLAGPIAYIQVTALSDDPIYKLDTKAFLRRSRAEGLINKKGIPHLTLSEFEALSERVKQ